MNPNRIASSCLAALLLVVCLTLSASPASGAFGDTTWVRTFDHDFYNWANWHQQTFDFPDAGILYRKIVVFYRIECPGAPADCDPWDRKGSLRVVGDPEWTEIARIVTPYDITGGNRPGHCVWEIDVSDYEPLLRGEVTLAHYIDTWIGDARGWIVTIDFAFIEGVPLLKPTRVVNLWQNDYLVYGNPQNPVENFLTPRVVDIDEGVAAVKLRMITTGHGQGNTDNCSEFCPKTHTFVSNGAVFNHILWRGDCEDNPCSPQGGTWLFDRAGWCPGDKVTPWDVFITNTVTPGQPATLDYDIQPYENVCAPYHPDCVPTGECPDCNFNYSGHTEPHWVVQTQLIYYTTIPAAVAEEVERGASVELLGNAPNPAQPSTWIRYSVAGSCEVRLAIHDAAGRLVRAIDRSHAAAGSFVVQWDGRTDGGQALPAGVYFCSLAPGKEAKRMLLIR